jgi:hypothetical protein
VLSRGMRRLVLAFALFAAAPASAAGDEAQPAAQVDGKIDRGPMGTNPVEDVSRPHEVLSDRPSGFWTSNRPAVGGAYKWRLLLIGCAIALLTGLFTWRLVKNAKGPPRARVIQR